MANSRALSELHTVHVRYLADGIEMVARVRLAHLPRVGELITFHGSGMDYDYEVKWLKWHMFAGGKGGDYGMAEINLGKCLSRRATYAS